MIGLNVSVFAQIPTISAAKPQPQTEEIQYVLDSTVNRQEYENLKAYKGCELFVMAKRFSEHGYRMFRKMEFDESDKQINPYSQEYVLYSIKSFPSGTEYDSLVNRVFIVDSVSYLASSSYRPDAVFYLREKGNDEFKCKYILSSISEFPFISIPYYNYLVSRYKDKEIVCYNLIHDVDIETGNEIQFNKAGYTHWICKDVVVEDHEKKLVLVLQSKDGKQKTYCDAALSGESKTPRLFTISEWNRLVNKYGAQAISNVMQEKIYVGMPKDLLIMSWGEPSTINRNSYGRDQWVYRWPGSSSDYVYVEKGRIVAWN